MKITDFKKEDLEKGIKIRRKAWVWSASLRLNKDTGVFDFYVNDNLTDSKVLTLNDITSDDWEVVKEPTQIWRPKYKELYYYITTHGYVRHDIFDTDVVDERANFGNAFKTEEEAKHMAKKLKIIVQLSNLSNIKFNEDNFEDKFVIYYDTESQQVRIINHSIRKELPFNVYFSSVKLAKEAIEIVGEDNLKKYYFDVEVKE